MTATRLDRNPLHLGLGASISVEPPFAVDDTGWFQSYIDRHRDDGNEGRLVTMYTFSESWPIWEMHPHGTEVVICTAGQMTILQEAPDGSRSSVTIGPGECAINEPGVWHTADVASEATAIFITAGIGTEHRSRGVPT